MSQSIEIVSEQRLMFAVLARRVEDRKAYWNAVTAEWTSCSHSIMFDRVHEFAFKLKPKGNNCFLLELGESSCTGKGRPPQVLTNVFAECFVGFDQQPPLITQKLTGSRNGKRGWTKSIKRHINQHREARK